jgi:hypothetical protein
MSADPSFLPFSLEADFVRRMKRLARKIVDECRRKAPSPLSYPDVLRSLPLSPSFREYVQSTARAMTTAVTSYSDKAWRCGRRRPPYSGKRRGEELLFHSQAAAIFRGLLDEIAGREKMASFLDDRISKNAALISSVPKTMAENLAGWAAQRSLQGVTSWTVARELEEMFPGAVKAKFATIARTELSKTKAAVTEFKSRSLKVPAYIWKASGGAKGDGRTRRSHKGMADVIVFWDEAPAPEDLFPMRTKSGRPYRNTLGHYHAGCCPNCRCAPMPLVFADDLKFPVRVYTGGKITRMNKADFDRLYRDKAGKLGKNPSSQDEGKPDASPPSASAREEEPVRIKSYSGFDPSASIPSMRPPSLSDDSEFDDYAGEGGALMEESRRELESIESEKPRIESEFARLKTEAGRLGAEDGPDAVKLERDIKALIEKIDDNLDRIRELGDSLNLGSLVRDSVPEFWENFQKSLKQNESEFKKFYEIIFDFWDSIKDAWYPERTEGLNKLAEESCAKTGIRNVSYKGLPVKTAAEFHRILIEFNDEFPDFAGCLDYYGTYNGLKYIMRKDISVNVGNKKKKEKINYAYELFPMDFYEDADLYHVELDAGGNTSRGIIIRRREYFTRPYSKIEEDNRRKEENGRFPKGCHTLKAKVWHEFGHLMDSVVGISSDIRIQNAISRLKDLGIDLSGYAYESLQADKYREVFAEAVSEAKCSPSPRKVAVDIWNMAEKVIQEWRKKK